MQNPWRIENVFKDVEHYEIENDINVVDLLVNSNVLDVDNSLGQSPRISIQKVNKNSVNDSVNENK